MNGFLTHIVVASFGARNPHVMFSQLANVRLSVLIELQETSVRIHNTYSNSGKMLC